MTLLSTSIFAVFGLIIGSFLNVCILRIPKKISIAKGRSYCPNCNNTLSPIELVPVFSYIGLKGKCKNCKVKISPRYAIVELITAIFFAICGGVFGIMQLELAVINSLFIAVLIVVAFIDFDTMEVPDTLHVIILCLGIVKTALGLQSFEHALIGTFIISVPMLIIAIFTNGFGGADIKLMAAAGLLLGPKSIVVAFIFAVFTMGSFGTVLIIRKKYLKQNYNNKVPFCPALVAGCILSIFLGDMIANWYLSLIIY